LVLLAANGEFVSKGHQLPEVSEEVAITDETLSENLPRSLQVKETEALSWDCPEGYRYLPREYATLNSDVICDTIEEWGIARLLGGSSLSGTSYDCEEKHFDLRNLGHAVCAKWSVANITIGEESCVENQVTVHPVDIPIYGHKICDMLEEWDIARIGVHGSIDGPGYGCTWHDVDTRSLNNTVCANLAIHDVVVVPIKEEDVCGEESSLITVPEVMSKLEKYCNYVQDVVEDTEPVRLSGGASLSKSADECFIHYEDDRELSLALCASIERPL